VVEHRCIPTATQRAGSGTVRSDTLISVDGQLKELHHERVTGLRALDVERAGERVLEFYLGERVGRTRNSTAKEIKCIGIERVTRMQRSNGFGRAKEGFCVVSGGVVSHYFWRRWRWSSSDARRLPRNLSPGYRRSE